MAGYMVILMYTWGYYCQVGGFQNPLSAPPPVGRGRANAASPPPRRRTVVIYFCLGFINIYFLLANVLRDGAVIHVCSVFFENSNVFW